MENIFTIMPKETSSLIIFFSKILSNVLNPIFSLLIFFSFYAYHFLSKEEFLKKMLLLLIILVIPISIYIYNNVKKGKFTNMDVSNRIQRKSLYIFITIALTIYLIINYFLEKKLDLVVFFLLILFVLMQISNYYIKSSMHTAANVFVSALFFSLNPVLGFIWLMLTLLVGISRIVLKRHTPKEVMMGGLIAFLVSITYLYININFH